MLQRLRYLLAVLAMLIVSACSKPQGVALPVDGGPPLGHYVCWTGGFDKLYSGEFDIEANGHYMGLLNRGGKFVYDVPKKTIIFTTGDFEYWDFIAVYQTAAESKNGRERLVLKDESWESPIGTERPGDYHYCYMDNRPHSAARGRDYHPGGSGLLSSVF